MTALSCLVKRREDATLYREDERRRGRRRETAVAFEFSCVRQVRRKSTLH